LTFLQVDLPSLPEIQQQLHSAAIRLHKTLVPKSLRQAAATESEEASRYSGVAVIHTHTHPLILISQTLVKHHQVHAAR
jgi:hypothetical protein